MVRFSLGNLIGGPEYEEEASGEGFTAFNKGVFVGVSQAELQYLGGEVVTFSGLDPDKWSFVDDVNKVDYGGDDSVDDFEVEGLM
ncbi:hypothetical protein A2U01_0013637 [Trifolium medium]|uniref:Uncharacterized protein n=1 Tax=Trifolium medium TaxID=97028 RepID=A0A392MYR7_9FABA|nr:hypothetical protein [Trifolium medium]